MQRKYGEADTFSLALPHDLVRWRCFSPFFTAVAITFYFCGLFSDTPIITTIQRRRQTSDCLNETWVEKQQIGDNRSTRGTTLCQ